MTKFIKESVVDFLKPKSTKDIDNEIKTIIYNFVDSISPKDFAIAFKVATEGGSSSKKIKQNNKVIYLADEETLIDIVEILLFYSEDDIDTFHEMSEFYMTMQQNNSIGIEEKDRIKNKIIYLLSKKFNVEY